ncbi:Ppx/GppA phosphatase family protein [Rubritalea sp.]|uniref:Ppx/GppA phosphatase family protein n=1 Tax=Rubritalea sp. TaxID=2109375 RepID=UPI003EF14FED
MSSETLAHQGSSNVSATIHIGASSISLLIFIPHEDGSSEQIDFLEQSAPIAHDVFSRGKITRTTIERCVNILTGYKQTLTEFVPVSAINKIRVVATNILSESSNIEVFLNRIHIGCDLDVEILDDGEMTRLIYLKTRRRLSDTPSMKSRTTLVLHVGPGNTRAILLKNGKITSYSSYRLGVHRTGERISSTSGRPSNYRKSVRSQIQGVLDSLIDEYRDEDIEHIVLIGYEIQLLRPHIKHFKDKSCSINALKELCDEASEMNDDEIVRSFQVDYQTAEAILPALEINLAVSEAFEPKRLHIPESDYEEGLLHDLNIIPSLSGDFSDEVLRSTEKVAEKYQVHMGHARQVARISLSLFEQLGDLHKLSRHDALLLQIAAILHEVGGFINNRAHHKHSQYIILNSEIFGLPKADVEIIALITRYHRNSVPKPTHSLYKDLDTHNRMRVSKLASFLRMADALDRSHSNKVKSIEIRTSRRRIHIYLQQVADAHTERLAMRSKGDLFENIFGLQINLVEDKLS